MNNVKVKKVKFILQLISSQLVSSQKLFFLIVKSHSATQRLPQLSN